MSFFYDKSCYFVYFDMWTLQKLSVIEVEEVGIALTCGIQTEYRTSETSHHFGREKRCVDSAERLHVIECLTCEEGDNFWFG